jgi:hypothetical protein
MHLEQPQEVDGVAADLLGDEQPVRAGDGVGGEQVDRVEVLLAHDCEALTQMATVSRSRYAT